VAGSSVGEVERWLHVGVPVRCCGARRSSAESESTDRSERCKKHSKKKSLKENPKLPTNHASRIFNYFRDMPLAVGLPSMRDTPGGNRNCPTRGYAPGNNGPAVGDVSDGGVEAHGVVVVDVCGDEAAGLLG
jgi:hypothetical protein